MFRITDSKIIFPPEIYDETTKNMKGNILDIGTADGYKLKNLLLRSNLEKITRIVAIDPSPLYKKAKERLKEIKGAEVYNLSIEDFDSKEKFNVILMLDTIEHLFDPKGALNKILSLLKPKGALICSTPNKWVYHLAEGIISKRTEQTHINEMTYSEFISLMNSYFEETKYIGVLSVMTLGRKFPRLLTLNRYLSFLPISRTIYCFAKKPRVKK